MEVATVSIDVDVADDATAERVAAEAWDAGALGLEEQEGSEGGIRVRIYAPERQAAQLCVSLERALGAAARVAPAEPVVPRDWSLAWREGLEAVRVSPRLVVAPSFVETRAEPEERVLIIDPGQAFGTGHHASTRLALSLLDDVLAGLGSEVEHARVLDAGTGTGVLAMGAAALGAAHAIGFDLDPVAVCEARLNARLNALAARTAFFIGPLEALAPIRFHVIVANMIRTEVMPLIPGFAHALAPEGVLILSGLLEADREAIELQVARSGLAVAEERSEADGGDRWVGYRLGPAG